MSYLVLSASFAYLCHGSTGFINIFYSLSVGIDFKRQILRSKVEPCPVGLKILPYLLNHWLIILTFDMGNTLL